MSQPTPLTDPILNTPWDPPTHYWVLDSQTNQATDQLDEGRRRSSGRILDPRSSKTAVQPQLGDSSVEPFHTINELRKLVEAWRTQHYPGATARTRQLLEFWSSDQHWFRPFFCQREAVETAIWLAEAGETANPNEWSGFVGQLEGVNLRWNDAIPRLAFKMATGSGKTVVMAMLMIWHAVNRTMPRDFLIIAPNLTVKDRLAELRSNHPDYLLPRLTPIDFHHELNRLRVTILNFQAFQRRNTLYVDGPSDSASKAVRNVLRKGADPRWQETTGQMLNRLLPAHRSGEPIVVINDEAHHCYRMDTRGLKKGSKEEQDEEGRAALWFSAIAGLQEQGRLARVFDLSATPMYLRRPAELQTEHFQWTISDYPLSDAIEAGLTKIPRLPVDDDTRNDNPVYRDVYKRTKPKKFNSDNMPELVRDLLDTMHQHYAESVAPAYAEHGVIPVMIVVANSIPNATALFRWIAGYRDEQNRFHAGNLPAFSNVLADRSDYAANPPTLLVHSRIVDDDGDAASPTGQIGKIAAEQAALFAPNAATKKQQVQAIRDIFNSVGRKDGPGEHIRCVISVGMLTEGWDAKTVTHVFGFRAFTSQLLCEQVTGRALRRTSFEPDPETGALGPEYANVFGVPYEFMRGVDNPIPPPPPKDPYVVEPVPGREHLRIQFPNLSGYAWVPPEHRCRLDRDAVRTYDIDPPDDPSETVAAGAIGEPAEFYDADITLQSAIWQTAANAVELFETEERQRRSLFPAMLAATREWLSHPKVRWVDGASLEARFPWLLRSPHNHDVPAEIARSVRDDRGEPTLLPVFADQRDPMQPRMRDTDIRPFQTTVKLVQETTKSELNRAPCHSNPEHALAQALDAHPQIEAWARNFRLGWTIPWRDRELGQWRSYEPDFVARVLTPDGEPPLHLIIECKGARFDDESAKAKADTTNNLWIPAVEHGLPEIGRWRYVYLGESTSIAGAISAAIVGADYA